MANTLSRLVAAVALFGTPALVASAQATAADIVIIDWDAGSSDDLAKLSVTGAGRFYLLGSLQRTYGAFDHPDGIFGLDLSDPLGDTFGTSGRFLAGPDGMVVRPDGSLVDLETFTGGRTVVTRDSHGTVVGSPATVFDSASSIALQPDGKILVGGAFDAPCLACATPAAKIVRLYGDGTVDATFNSPQITTGANTRVEQAVTLPDGKIALQSGGDLVLLNGDGTLATGFGLNSMVTFTSGIVAIAADFQNRIYALHGSNTVERVLEDGSTDSTFAANGVPTGTFTALALDSMQRPVLFGNVPGALSGPSSGRIVRLTSSGALDTTFATTGQIDITLPRPFGSIVVHHCTGDVQSDDRPVIACNIEGAGGTAGSDIAIARYNVDGTPDAALGAAVPDFQYYPDPFTIQDGSGPYGAAYVVSNPVTITGTNVKTAVSVTNVPGGSLSVGCTGQFTNAPQLISSDQPFCVRGSAADQPSSPATVTVNVGGREGIFTINSTATAAVTTPAAFSFTNQSDIDPGTTVTSNTVTISGITGFAAVTVSAGGGIARYSIGCSGAFTDMPGKIAPGQTICIQEVATSMAGASQTATLTVGGVGADFVVATKAAATPPPSNTGSTGGGAFDELSLAVLGVLTLVATRRRAARDLCDK